GCVSGCIDRRGHHPVLARRRVWLVRIRTLARSEREPAIVGGHAARLLPCEVSSPATCAARRAASVDCEAGDPRLPFVACRRERQSARTVLRLLYVACGRPGRRRVRLVLA